MRLDPTPGERDTQLSAGSPLVRKIGHYVSWTEYLWDTYVMSMDSSRQHEAIYRPMLDAIEQAFKQLSDPAWWRGVLSGVGHWLLACLVRLASFWGVVTVLAAMGGSLVVACYGFGIAPRRLLSRLAARAAGGKRSERSSVEFYRRLETILARHGLTRAPQQTQREFALQAGVSLAQATGMAPLAKLPLEIADAFYCVRFGDTMLDASLAETIKAALAELNKIEAIPNQPG
jgi:hypothetical protein